jgi:hypothetical protein
MSIASPFDGLPPYPLGRLFIWPFFAIFAILQSGLHRYLAILKYSFSHVSWYLRKKENVVAILSTGRNPNYLIFLSLPLDLLHVSDDINEIIKSSNTMIFAVPIY